MSTDAVQDWSVDKFRSGTTPLPQANLGWNTYGKGVENVGKDGAPESLDVPIKPNADQLLIRIDAVGLCFSDVKLVRQGGDHPKLYGRDLRVEPTRLGHEATVTVIEVGDNLADQYHAGQRLAIQPDIHVDGKATAYGYTIPGGLIQYHVIGSEVLDADDGAYVIPVTDDIGYAAAALSEPWACVEASYTQRRRLQPLEGGVMWIVGKADDAVEYTFTSGLDAPGTIVVSDVSEHVRSLVAEKNPGATVIERNGVPVDGYASLSAELTGERGFDDIVVLDPTSADAIEEIAKLIAFRGTMNMVGTKPLDGFPQIDVGRLHYHYTAYIGTNGTEISASYGEERNRADFVPGGVAVFVGAGGPMGQMHMQRAIETANGPSTILGIDLDDKRLAVAQSLLGDLAQEKGKEFVLFNPGNSDETEQEFIARHSGKDGADDVVVSVPVGPVMGSAATLMGPDGMLVLFAGVANGTMAPLNISNVYLHNAQFTGTSGSSIADQAMVLEKATEGSLSPERSLAAVGGIEAGQAGIQSMIDGDFAGKIMIFPQLTGLPLTGIDQLAEKVPEVGALLGEGNLWTREAEDKLLELFAIKE